MNLGVTQNSPRWGALCYPCGGPEVDTRGDPRNLTPEGDRVLSNNYLGRDKHLDRQCSCTPAARCRAFQRVTEHIIRDHSEALTRKWLDSKYQETFYPPMEGVTEPADEDATGRIEELEEELQEMSEKNTFIEEEVAGKLDQFTTVSGENVVLKAEVAEMLNKITQLKKVSDENVVLKAEAAEMLSQIRGLTAGLADAKKALVAREQAEEAREHWWLYKAFEKDAKGGEANVGPDASGMEVLEEAKEVGTNKQIEDKQTKKKGEKKKIECKECGYQARVPFVLAKHMERKHSANIFSCDKCKFTST